MVMGIIGYTHGVRQRPSPAIKLRRRIPATFFREKKPEVVPVAVPSVEMADGSIGGGDDGICTSTAGRPGGRTVNVDVDVSSAGGKQTAVEQAW
jgi:hypothetical protein